MRSALLITLLACLAAVPVARADGDPASDYLLGQQAFVPPDAAVSSSDSRQLLALVTGARASGYTIRVALIASRYDLGSVTVLDKRPKLYAHFLSQELRFLYKKRVLVVMSNGYGIARNGKPDPAEQKVLDRLPPPGSAYAGAAARAVRALAAHAGVHVVPSSITSARASGGTSTRDRLLIALGGLALVCAVLFATLYRRWR